jgi:hypothetical protein
VNQIAFISTTIAALAVASGRTSGIAPVTIGARNAIRRALRTKVKKWVGPSVRCQDELPARPTLAVRDDPGARHPATGSEGYWARSLASRRPAPTAAAKWLTWTGGGELHSAEVVPTAAELWIAFNNLLVTMHDGAYTPVVPKT